MHGRFNFLLVWLWWAFSGPQTFKAVPLLSLSSLNSVWAFSPQPLVARPCLHKVHVVSTPFRSSQLRSDISRTDKPLFSALAPLEDAASLVSHMPLFLSAYTPSLESNAATSQAPSALLSSSFDVAPGLLSTDNIKVAFSVATFFPQIFWLFLILLPNANVTKKLLGGYGKSSGNNCTLENSQNSRENLSSSLSVF